MTKSGRIDLLKLDIEGQELHLFTDVASWPALCEVRCMAAEVHEWLVKGSAASLERFLEVRLPVLPVISSFSLTETQKIVLNIHNFSVCTGTTGACCRCLLQLLLLTP